MAELSDREVISKLGGTAALAEAFGYKIDRVKAWRRIGIPWQHRAAVAKLAAEKGVELPTDFRDERRMAGPEQPRDAA